MPAQYFERAMSYRVAHEIHSKVQSLFTWAPDTEVFGKNEYWQDFADNVIRNEPFCGDCDDFALTCLVVGIESGLFKPEHCRVARVATESCPAPQPFDHAIAIYDGYILDNRQRKPIRLPDAMRLYKFYDYSDVPITHWRLYECQTPKT